MSAASGGAERPASGGGAERLSGGGGDGQPSDSGEIERLAGDPPSPYEGRFGFSRVVRAGHFVLVGGTTSIGEDEVVLGSSPYEQTVEILRKVVDELARGGAGVGDVVMTRCYVTDISRAEEVGRAHREVFGEVRPLMTMVAVAGLIDARMLVEIEAVGWVG